MAEPKIKPGESLPATALRRRCEPALFAFTSTEELEQQAVLAQARAEAAIRFATGRRRKGHNIYVLGPTGSGRHNFVMSVLEQRAAERPLADDWCYVNNFGDSRKPQALRLPAGTGQELREDVDHLVADARTAIPAAFESEDFHTRREAIEAEFKEHQEQAFEEVQKDARSRGIGVIPTPTGLVFAPLHKGEPLSPEAFEKLEKKEQEKIRQDTEALTARLREVMRAIPKRAREVRGHIRALEREVTTLAVGGLIEDLAQKYAALPEVVGYLEAMQADIVDNVELFLRPSKRQQAPSPPVTDEAATDAGLTSPAHRYSVNLIVDQTGNEGANVVFEQDSTFADLIGRIEHQSQWGALITDFTLIKPGALHLANGGYLVLDARKLLTQPFAWEALKRALKAREIRIRALGEALSLVSTISLEPEPIPLDVQVVLVGERMLYYLLKQYDPEFSELFKIAADFDDEMEWSDENAQQFARVIATHCSREKLPHLDCSGLTRLLEESARLASDSERLSTEIQETFDIIDEAAYWAEEGGKALIGAAEIERAIGERVARASRVRDRMQEEILRQTLLIETDGSRVGQVNGLSVMQLGGFSFGRPSRISARVSLGSGKVVDIEREVELGGPLHSKGVFILSGFLSSNYVDDRPLSLAASLVFEQSYGGVEGDSASAAELCALLSALAETPIRQGLAVTGSVNQHGEIQAIGGVNEKIEGFFDICSKRGLTGDQGVVIPLANVKHLMLRQDVVEAVAGGKFSVWPAERIDHCLELLTGTPAGDKGANGEFPADSVNHRVRSRLIDFARKRRSYSGRVGKRESDAGKA